MRTHFESSRRAGILFIVGLSASLLATAAFAIEPQGTTIKRAPDGCTVLFTLQVAVDGDSADFVNVKNALTSCFGTACTVPCPIPLILSCGLTVTVDVKKKSDIAAADQAKYHQVRIVGDIGTSSCTIKPPNGPSGSGRWYKHPDRGATLRDRTYCHETLHLCGLRDKYCDLRKRVTGLTEDFLSCPDPPGPKPCNCTIAMEKTRCTKPCTGSEEDIMASLLKPFRCANLLEVLALASLNSCPDACCRATAVSGLSSLAAQSTESGVEVQWGVRARDEYLGFYVLRSAAGGSFARVTDEMIPNSAEAFPAVLSWIDRAAEVGTDYAYQIEVVYPDGTPEVWEQVVTARAIGRTPLAFALRLTGPNPLRSQDGIGFAYDVPHQGADVSISLFDASGRRVAGLVEGRVEPGSHAGPTRVADLGRLSAGVYFLQMEAGEFRATERIVLMK